MNEGKKEGFAALMDEIGAGDVPVCDNEQLALFNDVHDDHSEEKDDCSVDDCEGIKRGVGRPKGARNKSSEDVRAYIRNKHKLMPLDFLCSLFNESTVNLAMQRHCKFADALKIQTSAASAALPYMHQKMPLEVAVSETKRHLVLLEGMTSEAEEILRSEDAIIIEVDENGEEIND